jgi:hypothetical protein
MTEVSQGPAQILELIESRIAWSFLNAAADYVGPLYRSAREFETNWARRRTSPPHVITYKNVFFSVSCYSELASPGENSLLKL